MATVSMAQIRQGVYNHLNGQAWCVQKAGHTAISEAILSARGNVLTRVGSASLAGALCTAQGFSCNGIYVVFPLGATRTDLGTNATGKGQPVFSVVGVTHSTRQTSLVTLEKLLTMPSPRSGPIHYAIVGDCIVTKTPPDNGTTLTVYFITTPVALADGADLPEDQRLASAICAEAALQLAQCFPSTSPERLQALAQERDSIIAALRGDVAADVTLEYEGRTGRSVDGSKPGQGGA